MLSAATSRKHRATLFSAISFKAALISCWPTRRLRWSGATATVEITDRFTAKQAVPEFLGRAFVPGDEMELRLRGSYELRDGALWRIAIAPRD